MTRAEFLTEEIRRIDGTIPNPMNSKHSKMATSPFVFFRGTAQLFYADLRAQRIKLPEAFNQMPLTCVLGDCHTSNFGFITEEGSHGDTVIFAPNDFDDACVGVAGWDILRFLISLALVVEHCQGARTGKYDAPQVDPDKPSVEPDQVVNAMHSFLQSYLDTCTELVDFPEAIYRTLNHFPDSSALHKCYSKACRRAAGGEDFTAKSALAKSIEFGEDGLRFRRKEPKFIKLAPHLYQQLSWNFSPYMDDAVIDVVERTDSGTGSVNMERFYFLVGPARPHTEASFARCHIVEVKAQRLAAPLHYFDELHPVNRLNPAHLTARCQKRMQRRPDLLLDEVEWQNKHWLIRSRHHAKVGIGPQDIAAGRKNVNGGFNEYARWCGQALCLAHCRGDRRSTLLEQAMVRHLANAIPSLIETALDYALQVLEDHSWLVARLEAGKSMG
ncbi:DUF2252 domain-containing protein [Alteromonas aestuariivivens]|uniref:DUF2252 domain-containing protein n=1 Tax=Alteromonas aestuariivivens TaxID=1938339 RepID=A0A3D8M490_9ALTE|nr:DUF2252 family protein [Alteromonas aestuariivivens]RDV24509.1 DUF2252 domain-containing protein [Alteromonas aestuariivivens]